MFVQIQRAALWIGVLGLVGYNIFASMSGFMPYEAERKNILMFPFMEESYTRLGASLYDVGEIYMAKHELDIAQDVASKTTSSSVLGASTPSEALFTSWETQRNSLATTYVFWQHVVDEKPDYRDAYVYLATLAYALHMREDAVSYLDAAYELDANNAVIKHLTEEIKR